MGSGSGCTNWPPLLVWVGGPPIDGRAARDWSTVGNRVRRAASCEARAPSSARVGAVSDELNLPRPSRNVDHVGKILSIPNRPQLDRLAHSRALTKGPRSAGPRQTVIKSVHLLR
jgi:hypothetical protein